MTSQLRTVLLGLLCCRMCAGFNLDSRFAVIKEGRTPGSLFGLSVAMHRQTVKPARYLLLVGAPQEKAEPKLQANQTGDMYACPITTDPKDCIRANLVTSDSVDSEDVIEGMWLGVSVVSQGSKNGRVMACGHRYSRSMDNGANLRMIGKCYIRGNDLSYDEINDYQWQQPQEVCSPAGNQEVEGMCNMGIAATMTETEVIAGAPGCYNWQGNAYVVYMNPADKFDRQTIKLPDLDIGNIYIGYSVGKDKGILSKTADTVVAGAPRYGSKGSVMLMVIETNNDDSSKLKKVNLTLYGEQVGSYFGNSIAIVDINNDGWKELIVGAPFYFNRTSEEGGSVYVFMNENGSFKPEPYRKFTGARESGFGMAVSYIGDVNQDGFSDFAVGAPYHGSGSISVWMGGKDGISLKADQTTLVSCTSKDGFVLCELGNPLAANQMVAFAIVFETSFITLDTKEITSTLQLSTLSIQNDLMPLTKVLLVDYTLHTTFQVNPNRFQTEFSGQVIGESAIKSTNEIGSPVKFEFWVYVDKPLGNDSVLYVEFNWPMEVANGKWLLYVEEITMMGTSQSFCNADVVNPLNYKVSERKSSRQKRDEQSVTHLGALSTQILKSGRKQTDHLNCTSRTAKCQTFNCPLHNMMKTASVTVWARLWNSTMLEDYNKASLIIVTGEATLKLNTNRTTVHLDSKSNSLQFSVEVSPLIQDPVEYNVPLWIIIVSALAGVLLLALIVLLLWKCGFFRRANTREIYEAKSQKAEMRTQPSEKDRLTEEE